MTPFVIIKPGITAGEERLRPTKAWGNAYRTTTLCVNSCENGVLAGRFYDPYLETGRIFSSLTQFLAEMEQALDAMEFPRSFTAARAFAPLPEFQVPSSAPETRSGRLATFAVRVIFRQNASWQGSLLWLEGQREQSFRSVPELIFLLDSALHPEKLPE